MATLLAQEQEASKAARDATGLLQQDLSQCMELYNKLKAKKTTLAEDLNKVVSNYKEAKLR